MEQHRPSHPDLDSLAKAELLEAQLRATEYLYQTLHKRLQESERRAREAEGEAEALRRECAQLQSQGEADRAQIAELGQQLRFVKQSARPAAHALTLADLKEYAIGTRSKPQAEAVVNLINEVFPRDEERTLAVEGIRSHFDRPKEPTTQIGVLNNHGSINDIRDSQVHQLLPKAAEM